MNALSQQVYDYLLTIPYGHVATYGQIARRLGNPHLARAIGNILHANPDPVRYPCYKVVNARGRLAPAFGDGGPEVQRERLEREGIRVENGYVNLREYGFADEEQSSVSAPLP